MAQVAAILRVFVALATATLLPVYGFAESLPWKDVADGYSVATYEISSAGSVLRSPVILARFNPKSFSFHAAVASDFGSLRADVRTMTKALGGVAGINANFFDPNGEALGLVISDGELRVKLHGGGSVLNGIFYIEKSTPHIVSRDTYAAGLETMAVQAGPLLIANDRVLKVSAAHAPNRRSGIAITRSGDVILYATQLRFPGATLAEIQQMLVSAEARDALSFDGGGSSQLYLDRGSAKDEELSISGGDIVPVALVVRRRSMQTASSAPNARAR